MPTVTLPEKPIKRPLDRTEMEYLKALPSGDRLPALCRCVLGAEAYDSATRVDPGRTSIPAAQWFALVDVVADNVDDVLYWEKYGPDFYGATPGMIAKLEALEDAAVAEGTVSNVA